MTQRRPETTHEFQQTRGVGWDVVDQAIGTYDSWMLDDDFDANRVLKEIIEQMRRRRSFYMPNERVADGESEPEK